MNSRQRFLETMRYGSPDRVPYFEEGIRDEVLDSWYKQGLAPGTDPGQLFPTDLREEIETDLEPRPKPKKWPAAIHDLTSYRKRLDPEDHDRLPAPWADRIRQWKKRDHALLLRVHRGFFLSLGVFGWDRFTEVILRTVDDPEFIRESMRMQGEFAARLADRVLRQVTVDAAVFSEPIGGNTGPLISPDMYEDFCLKNYKPLLRVLNQHGVEFIVFRTFANARILIPGILKWGFNCLWACEVSVDAMDYRDLRREFGRDLRLIGGIDLDALRHSKEAIRKELEDKVPPLLQEGGYVPLADGRVREDVPFDHYVYYRECLDDIIRRSRG